MRKRLPSIALVTALILALLLPNHIQATGPGSISLQSSLQGEIAYVLDGDIWLLDLLTGESQQLTTDGDNRWPTWSTDGRYLLYTHGNMEETAALYILEVGQGEPRLLAENACCAAWEPEGDRIAYIALAGGELAIEAVRPDGSSQETLFSPLLHGRSNWPTSHIGWYQDVSRELEIIVAPLEIIESSTEGKLMIYNGSIAVNLLTQDLQLVDQGSCIARRIVPENSSNLDNSALLAIEIDSVSCVSETSDSKLMIQITEANNKHNLPWLAYPFHQAANIWQQNATTKLTIPPMLS